MLLVLWVVYLILVIKFSFSTLNDTCSCLCLDFGTQSASPFLMIDGFG